MTKIAPRNPAWQVSQPPPAPAFPPSGVNPLDVITANTPEQLPAGARVWIGIDPGMSGGIAVIGHDGSFISAIPMPTIQIGKSLKTVDATEVYEFIIRAALCGKVRVVMEQVSAMPGQGVSSMFSFGAGYGLLLGVLQILGCTYELVSPAKWKRDTGLTKDKNLSLGKARQLWPDAPLKFKKNEGVAEALLLADWLRRSEAGR